MRNNSALLVFTDENNLEFACQQCFREEKSMPTTGGVSRLNKDLIYCCSENKII